LILQKKSILFIFLGRKVSIFDATLPLLKKVASKNDKNSVKKVAKVAKWIFLTPLFLKVALKQKGMNQLANNQ
jgi:hypothetical protein